MIRVSLVKPPAIQSATRGAGIYGQNLTEALKKVPGLEITNANPDITHYLYFDPFFLTLPPIKKNKTVVTVFDLTPIILKDLFPRGLRGEIKWQIQKNLLKTVDAVITISQSAKNDIKKFVMKRGRGIFSGSAILFPTTIPTPAGTESLIKFKISPGECWPSPSIVITAS